MIILDSSHSSTLLWVKSVKIVNVSHKAGRQAHLPDLQEKKTKWKNFLGENRFFFFLLQGFKGEKLLRWAGGSSSFLLTHLPKISLLWLQEELEQNCSRYFPSLFTKLLLKLHFKERQTFPAPQTPTLHGKPKGKWKKHFFNGKNFHFLRPNVCEGAVRV